MKIIEKLIKRFPKNEEFFKGLEEVKAKKIKVEKVIDIPLRYKEYYLHFEVNGNQFRCILNRDTTSLTLNPQIYNVASIDLAEDIPYANVINILKLLKSKEETMLSCVGLDFKLTAIDQDKKYEMFENEVFCIAKKVSRKYDLKDPVVITYTFGGPDLVFEYNIESSRFNEKMFNQIRDEFKKCEYGYVVDPYEVHAGTYTDDPAHRVKIKLEEETTDPDEYDYGPTFAPLAKVGDIVFVQQLIMNKFNEYEYIDVTGEVIKVEYDEQKFEYVYYVKIKNSNKVVKTTDVWRY